MTSADSALGGDGGTRMKRVLVVGSVNYDLSFRLRRLPSPGETVSASSLMRTPGGKGANQAVAARAAGTTCAIVCVVGVDGGPLIEQLRDHGVDVSHARCDAGDVTGTAVIMVDESGQNSIVVSAGANALLTPEDVHAALAASDGDLVLTQGESPAAVVTAAADAASAAARRFVLNLAPVIPLPSHVIEAADPLIVNESEAIEAAAMLGVDMRGRGGADLVRELARHARSVVITLGAEGAIWAASGVVGTSEAARVDVVDTTGAGDAFVGALVAHLAEGRLLGDAVRAGVQAGTEAVQIRGARATDPVTR